MLFPCNILSLFYLPFSYYLFPSPYVFIITLFYHYVNTFYEIYSTNMIKTFRQMLCSFCSLFNTIYVVVLKS
nr:MAG TPA: hypothetical protein [Caudoviricetes sp.]